MMERDCPWAHRPAFFPTVAWPSEAVREHDVSITVIQKRVEDPFYEPRGAAGLIKAHTQLPGGLVNSLAVGYGLNEIICLQSIT
jgi:hypothetical protein